MGSLSTDRTRIAELKSTLSLLIDQGCVDITKMDALVNIDAFLEYLGNERCDSNLNPWEYSTDHSANVADPDYEGHPAQEYINSLMEKISDG